MAENAVFLLLTALIRNFYKDVMAKIDARDLGLKAVSRIKAFVFKFISVPAKWVKTARQCVLNMYADNHAYASLFPTVPPADASDLRVVNSVLSQAASWDKGRLCTSAAFRSLFPAIGITNQLQTSCIIPQQTKLRI